MENVFFDRAMNKAASYGSNKYRLLRLLAQLVIKIKHTDFSRYTAQQLKSKLQLVGRLMVLYAKGTYREVSWKSVMILIAGIVYFINPLDVIPDFLPVTGLTDDLGVLLWVFKVTQEELEKFIRWEASHANTYP